MDLEKETEYYKKIILEEVTLSRFDHSLRVAELAEKFSLLHGYIQPRKAYLAGILHDITKQKTNNFHVELFNCNQFDFESFPISAYHAFSAVFYLREKFQFADEEILSAIKNHTLGGNLSVLDQILFVSDFLGSDYALRQEEYADWLAQTEKKLAFGIILKCKAVFSELIEKNCPIHPFTLATYNHYVKH